MSAANRLGMTLLLLLAGAVSAAAQTPEAGDARQGTIIGRITDAATDRPLVGAQLFLPELERGTLAREGGSYEIPSVPSGTYRIEVTFIGYASAGQQVTVVADEQVVADFTLQSRAIALDAVVVTGAGVQEERRRLGFASASVGSAELEARPIHNVTEALRGQIPGVMPSSPLGDTGGASPIRFRGQASLTQRSEPLLIIDGVRQDGSVSQFRNQLTSRLDDINPRDIERVEIIKGAAAATLFGTEASAGVIQIFTKQGSEGSARYAFSIDQGLYRIPLGRIPPNRAYNHETRSFVEQHPMQDILGTGHVQDYNLSISGGMPNVNYYVSGRFMHENGAEPASVVENMSVRSRFDMNHGDRLRTELGLSVIQNRNRVPMSFGGGPTGIGTYGVHVFANPLARAPEEGRPYGEGFVAAADLTTGANWEVARRYAVDFKASYQWSSNLTSQAVVGYNHMDREFSHTAELGEAILVSANLTGRREVSNTWRSGLTLDFNTAWQTRLTDRLGVQLWGGTQAFFDRSTTRNTTAVDFAAPGLTTISGAATVSDAGETYEEVVNAGVFTQAQLDYEDRVFLTAGLRADGNSAFGETIGLTPYPKVSGSYVLSDEPFWPAGSGIGLIRLRAAYGQSGLQPGAFDAVQTFLPRSRLDGVSILWPGNKGNPELKAERSSELEAGVDLGLLDSRIGMELTYYTRTTSDAIVPVPLKASGGFTESQLLNVGEMETDGFEALVRWDPIRRPNLDWSLTATIATVNQKVTELGTESYVISGQRAEAVVAEGHAPGVFRTHILDEDNPYTLTVPTIDELTRLDQIVANRLQTAGGEDSLVYHKAGIPRLTGTFATELGLPGDLRLRALFSGAAGFSQFSQGDAIMYQAGIDPSAARFAAELDDPNTSTERRQEIALEHARKVDTIWGNWIEDGDYLRFQELSLTYRLPQSYAALLRLANLSINLAAQNLALWTSWSGSSDPGLASQSSRSILVTDNRMHLPSPRSLSVSFQGGW